MVNLSSENLLFCERGSCDIAIIHQVNDDQNLSKCLVTQVTMTSIFTDIPIVLSRENLGEFSLEEIQDKFNKEHIFDSKKPQELTELFWKRYPDSEPVKMKECNPTNLLNMILENRKELNWVALKYYFLDFSKCTAYITTCPFEVINQSENFDHPFILWFVGLISKTIWNDNAFAFLSELAIQKEWEGIDRQEVHQANEKPFKEITEVQATHHIPEYKKYLEKVINQYPVEYSEWKAKILYLHSNFEKVINELGSIDQPLASEGAMLMALSQIQYKPGVREVIEDAIELLEKVEQENRTSRLKLLLWKLYVKLNSDLVNMNVKKVDNPDHDGEDVLNSMVRYYKEFQSGFVAILVGIIFAVFRFRNIFWSMYTKRSISHTNLLENIDKMINFVDRMFQPGNYQNPPSIAEIIPLTEKITIGLSQLDKDHQNQLLTHQKTAVQLFFQMVFSSPDEKVRQIALTALTNLAKDYRRCGYVSKWYKDLLIDISDDFYSNWAEKDRRSQLLNAIWINDPEVLLYSCLSQKRSYIDHGWEVWISAHEYVMRLFY